MNWVMFLFPILLEFCKGYLLPEGADVDAKVLVELLLHLLLCALSLQCQCYLFVFSMFAFHHILTVGEKTCFLTSPEFVLLSTEVVMSLSYAD